MALQTTCLCLPSPSLVKRRALKYLPTRAKASLPNTCSDAGHQYCSLRACFGLCCTTRCVISRSKPRHGENSALFQIVRCHRDSGMESMAIARMLHNICTLQHEQPQKRLPSRRHLSQSISPRSQSRYMRMQVQYARQLKVWDK